MPAKKITEWYHSRIFKPFTRKLNRDNLIRQVFWLGLLLYLPASLGLQWFEVGANGMLFPKPYSYGDSAGFTPDFPFNGAKGANRYGCKSRGAVLLLQNQVIHIELFTCVHFNLFISIADRYNEQ